MDGDEPGADGFEDTADALDELAQVAPDEIRPSITNAARVVRDVVELVASIDVDDPSAVDDPELLQRVRALEEQEAALRPELDRVSEFLDEECGVSR